MKKGLIIFSMLAMVFCGNQIFAQVSQSPELATKIKDEGLNNSKIEEISQYMTDLVGSRLTASKQKRRAESLVVKKLNEIGLSNPRAEFAAEFTRGGWDVVKTYAAMTQPYYCAFSVNPKAWSGSTKGLVKGECMIFDVQSKEDIEKYNDEPVFYCRKCLSLKIRNIPGEENSDYCDDCGGTEIGAIDIYNWEYMYKQKYGKSFLES